MCTVGGHNSRIPSSRVSLVSAKLAKIQRKFTVFLCEVVIEVLKKTSFRDLKKYSHSFLEYSICRGFNYVSYLYDQVFRWDKMPLQEPSGGNPAFATTVIRK